MKKKEIVRANKLKIIMIVVLLLILSLISFVAIYTHNMLKPTNIIVESAKSNKTIEFEIIEGDTTQSVLKRLQDKNIINSATFADVFNDSFKNYSFYVGKYNIPSAIGGKEVTLNYILSYLADPANIISVVEE